VVGTALNDLLQHLGIARAHIAAARLARTDWSGLAAMHPERIASLTLVSPLPMDTTELQALGSRLLVLQGDRGRPAQSSAQVLASLPHAAPYTLRDYECLPWADVMVDRGAEVAAAMLDFLDRVSRDDNLASPNLPPQQGEVEGISYDIRGAGPPLLLMPLDLTPSQWEPVLSRLAESYCTITLGSPYFGAVSLLEGRGQSNYLSVVRALLDAVRIQQGDVILEVGCGSGVAGGIGHRSSLGRQQRRRGTFLYRHGGRRCRPDAERTGAGDASRRTDCRHGARRRHALLGEPGVEWCVAIEVDRPGLIAGVMSEGGCADDSLYRRFRSAGLSELMFSPQFVARTRRVPAEADALAGWVQRILGVLTPLEAEECRRAIAQAEADGTFFIAMGYHCAAGRKPM
jgi:hypothetical protein